MNALTIDLEDYFHVTGFEKDIPRSRWNRFDCRIVPNTKRLLGLLDRHGVKATFFVLGWVAQRFPELVQEIHNSGHEIGSHGYWHRLVYEQSPEEFRLDLRQSREVLGDVIGQGVTAYRAPSFSITQESLWALDILADEGFRVDSSIMPIHHDRYGIPNAEPGLHQRKTSAGRLWEFPPSVVRFAGRNFPVGGGGYFRLCPLGWTLYCLSRLNRRGQQPFMFYAHPWEIDPAQPRLKAGSRFSRFRHRVNLATTEHKLDTLLRSFRFGRLCDVIEQIRP
ncbi:MAG: hypothetical protein A2V70_18255 [Planctomycetes bacterium RBG_13_63_9]|nr:MAG: hypothetical protein A2V70_18255 [Planctomycetes bacterium RBG_13_63_9]